MVYYRELALSLLDLVVVPFLFENFWCPWLEDMFKFRLADIKFICFIFIARTSSSLLTFEPVAWCVFGMMKT